MDELISKQQAIDALIKMLSDCFYADEEVLDAVKTTLNELPPAQPEPQIIYCKYCGRRDEYGCCTYWKGLTTGFFPIAVDDDEFCSHARRRTNG